jgi:hypothetical protein
MSNIEVTYDGAFPNACSGTLTIKVDGSLIYDEYSCCESTGGVCFDIDWNENVIGGKLVWNDADKFSKEIQGAVKEVLDKVEVCCGGCV